MEARRSESSRGECAEGGSFAKNRSVIAGPGAGKTELLAQRAAFLLQTDAAPSPRRILAISFKRDAASNLAARVRQRCHHTHASRFDSMTFDAFAKDWSTASVRHCLTAGGQDPTTRSRLTMNEIFASFSMTFQRRLR
ncbi:UvrD-helicase domain-containing protein [Pseudomonas sp. NA13]